MKSTRLFKSGALLALILTGIFFLAGCSKKPAPQVYRPPDKIQDKIQTGQPSRHHPTLKPYKILGQTYHPIHDPTGFSETGIASWYGPKFHGKSTANGETFNMYDMTCAHRILPMQTKIQVTNMDNGKTVLVRVNDRGPFAKNRVVDLSYEAARRLNIIGPGTAKVHIKAQGSWAHGIPGTFYIQVGSFAVRSNAEKLLAKIKSQGYTKSRMVKAVVDKETLYRVQAGAFATLEHAERAKDRLESLAPSCFVIAD